MAEGDPTPSPTPAPSPAPAPASWADALPQTIRGHAALADVKDVGDLATRYVSYHGPLAERLPKDIAGEAAFKDIKDYDALARSYLSAQKMIGVPKDQILRLPTTDKPEDWAPVYDRLGRPKTAAEYKLEGDVDPETMKWLGETAYQQGLTQKQLAGMHKALAERVGTLQAGNQEQTQAKLDAAVADLKTTWGAAYNEKLEKTSVALNVLEKDFPGIMKELDAARLGPSPQIAKFLAKYADSLPEDRFTGKMSGGFETKSPNEAKQEIAAQQLDPSFMKAYRDRSHPGHAAAMDKMTALYAQAYPSAA